jgi:hypothetical protein
MNLKPLIVLLAIRHTQMEIRASGNNPDYEIKRIVISIFSIVIISKF